MAEPLRTIPPPPPPPEPVAPPLVRPWFYWLVGVLVLACVALVVVLNILGERQRLTRDKLDAARLRWREANIRDYDIDVRVSGSAPGHYQVRVRDGVVVQAWMNGRPFEELRLARPWTVTGMLEDVLPRELETLDKMGSQRCYSSVEFDPKLGYPRKYLHTVNQRTTSWEVRLELVAPAAAAVPSGAVNRTPPAP